MVYPLPNDRWGKSDVTVELTGEEWFTIIAVMGGYRKKLSPEGKEVAVRATKRLLGAISFSSNKFKAQEE